MKPGYNMSTPLNQLEKFTYTFFNTEKFTSTYFNTLLNQIGSSQTGSTTEIAKVTFLSELCVMQFNRDIYFSHATHLRH